MTAPVIPNAAVVAMVLIDATTGVPYRVGQPPTASKLPIPNAVALGTSLINPVTGLPYH